jgi:hypothetical protein
MLKHFPSNAAKRVPERIGARRPVRAHDNQVDVRRARRLDDYFGGHTKCNIQGNVLWQPVTAANIR